MRVLFVGNSYTLYHDVPSQVVALASSLGRVVEASSVLQGGADWKLHRDSLGTPARIAEGFGGRLRWSSPSGGGLYQRPQEEGFDVVVLQGKSTDPLLARFAFARHGAALACLARRHGARVVFEQTWAWASDHPSYRNRWTQGSPEAWTRHVRRAYARLALVTSSEIAPVGDAWLRAQGQAPDFDLHDVDRHHASPLGAHLAALVLTTTIARVDVRTTTWRPPEVSVEAAQVLRTIAATT